MFMTHQLSLRDLVYALQGHIFGHAVGDEPDLHQLSDAQFADFRNSAIYSNLHHPSREGDEDLHTVLGEIVREIFLDHDGKDRPRSHVPDYDHFCFLAGRVSAALDGRELPRWTPEYLVRDRILRSDQPAETPGKELSAIEAFLRLHPNCPDDELFVTTWEAAKARREQIADAALRACFKPAQPSSPAM